MKIAHLTSVHPRYDTRIYYKMCNSLAKRGHEVYLIVADGKGDEEINRVLILDVGATIGRRFSRMTKTVKRVFEKAKELNVDIYHLHDPELIPIGLRLKKLGKKVIFDSHELVGDQIIDKDYLPNFLRNTISKIYSYYEKYSLKKLNLIGATPHIRDHLKKINKDAIDICNYPTLDNHIFDNIESTKQSSKINYICYVGGISKIRGIKELVKALELINNKVVLNLAGNFSSTAFEKEIRNLPGWKNVNYLGFVEKNYLMSKYNNKFGVVPFLEAPNHIYSQPNKMFEYMSYKLPIICSNFNLWKDLMETYNCGKVFNPEDPRSIAKVIDYLIDNPEESKKIGQNGYQVIIDKFNWKNEEKKLFSFYDKIINSK